MAAKTTAKVKDSIRDSIKVGSKDSKHLNGKHVNGKQGDTEVIKEIDSFILTEQETEKLLAERSGIADWILKATGYLLQTAQEGEANALACLREIREIISQRHDDIIRKTKDKGDDKLISIIDDDLSFGSYAINHSISRQKKQDSGNGTGGVGGTNGAGGAGRRQLRIYYVLSAARAIILAEAEAILLDWWQAWQQADSDLQNQDLKADDFFIQTSQEFDALLCSICDGSRGLNWKTNVKAGIRVYERSGLAHAVRLELSEDEKDSGLTTDILQRLTIAQDADAVFAVLYVSRLLAPPGPPPPNMRAGAWVSADDIIEKIGWTPRSSEERLAMRRRVWNYLRFGARACVTGRRSSKYFDKTTGQEIDTYIDGPAWAFLEEEKPVQPSPFPVDEVPVRVELVASREWTSLTTAPFLAQYLPMGELLGSITPDQPSGAWARVLGLALASFWRRQPHAALDGHLKPTRREILQHYPPKISPPDELLTSKHPRRAIEYWFNALQILTQNGFLAREGEAIRSVQDISKSLPRYNWGEVWLDEAVDLRPGPAMRPAVQACVDSLPLARPRALIPAKKRGRPRKIPQGVK